MIAWGFSLFVVVGGSLLPATVLHQLPAVAVPDDEKAAHLVAYVVLAFLPVAAVDTLRRGLILALAMIPLGILLELLQRLIPGRSFEVADMGANTLGVFTGVVAGLWVRWRSRNAAAAIE